MSHHSPALSSWPVHRGRSAHIAFVGSSVAACGVWAIAHYKLPELALPIVIAFLFCMAAALALCALVRPHRDRVSPSYWDAAGALVFIGICVSALVEPEQMVRLVESAKWSG